MPRCWRPTPAARSPEDGLEFYRAAGWDQAALDNYTTRFGGFGKAMHALPDSYRRLVDGETLTIGGREWRVVTGSGHSPEHACLHCPELKLFISGDQVLPKITSNVSVFPTEPEGDPLDDWLTSLARIKTASSPMTCWCCRPTTTRSSACTRASTS